MSRHPRTDHGQGRGRLYWVVKSLGPGWELQYDRELTQLPTPPLAALGVRLQEVDFIRFLQWYDRNGNSFFDHGDTEGTERK